MTVRYIAAETTVGLREAAFRRDLQARYGLAEAAQAQIEVLDAAARPVRCSPDDLFAAVGAACARQSADALAGTSAGGRLRALDEGDDPEALAACLAVSLGEGSARPPPPTWPHRSRYGLGYRVLQAPPASGFAGRRVCLFAHFDPDDRLDPYVIRYLAALKACGLDILLITASDLSPEALAPAVPLLAGAIRRQNLGLDFSGWALALELHPGLAGAEAVIIANDSVYGPVGDLGGMIDGMDAAGFDVWGAVETHEIAEHVQSWFIGFTSQALRAPAFAAFWSAVTPLTNKAAVIDAYELTLLRTFKRAGLKVGAASDLLALQVANGNPTLKPWRALLKQGVPFVKVQLLRENPLDADIHGWTGEVEARGYPARLILDHLGRTAGRSAAGLQTH